MQTKNLIIAGAIVCIATQLHPAAAEPSPTVSYLMNEPASLFDVGLIRMNDSLRRFNRMHPIDLSEKPMMGLLRGETDLDIENIGFGTLYAKYSWDENRINIYALVFAIGEEDEANRHVCADLIEYLRFGLFGILPAFIENVGKPMDRNEPGNRQVLEVVGGWFDHQDYQSSNRPKYLEVEIMKLMRISVQVNDMLMEGNTCEAPLLSTAPPMYR